MLSDSDNSFLCVSRLENPPSTLFSSSIEFSTMELILLYSASIAVCLRESRTSVVQLHCHYTAAAATLTRSNRGCVMIRWVQILFVSRIQRTWKASLKHFLQLRHVLEIGTEIHSVKRKKVSKFWSNSIVIQTN